MEILTGSVKDLPSDVEKIPPSDFGDSIGASESWSGFL